MTVLALAITCAACLLLYLSHVNQRWLLHPLAAIPWRWLGWILCLIAPFFWSYSLQTSTAVFAWLVAVMLFFGVLPFAVLLRRNVKTEQRL